MIISKSKYRGILIEVNKLESDKKELNEINRELGISLLGKQEELEEAQKQINSYKKLIDILNGEYAILENKQEETETLRRKTAGKIGGLTKKINHLEEENKELANKLKALEEEKKEYWILKKLPSGKAPNTLKTKHVRDMSNNVRNYMKKEFD